jgi:hypothetical protein
MPAVTVDGIVYVPLAEIPELTDERLKLALQGLVSIQYFDESRKAKAQAWDVLNILAPDLAQLAADNPKAAFDRMHPEESDLVLNEMTIEGN